MRMRRRFDATLQAAVVLAAAPTLLGSGFAAAVLAQPTAIANSATYTDQVGDNGSGPDISTVSVSDDPATGMLRVAATARLMQTNTAVDVLLDVDKNPATGAVNGLYGAKGIEFILAFSTTAKRTDWSVIPYVGQSSQGYDTWAVGTKPPSASFTRDGDVLTWTLDRSALRDTAGFAFAVYAWLWKDTATGGRHTLGSDRAPDADRGTWTYDLSPRTPTTATTGGSTSSTTNRVLTRSVIGKPAVTPSKPRAGKPVTFNFPVRRSDTGGPLLHATMTCDPSIGGKTIPHKERFGNGIAHVSFIVPKNAHGKMLKVRVTIKYGASVATKSVVFRVA